MQPKHVKCAGFLRAVLDQFQGTLINDFRNNDFVLVTFYETPNGFSLRGGYLTIWSLRGDRVYEIGERIIFVSCNKPQHPVRPCLGRIGVLTHMSPLLRTRIMPPDIQG